MWLYEYGNSFHTHSKWAGGCFLPSLLPPRSYNPGCLPDCLCLSWPWARKVQSRRMGTFFSEPGWLCLTVTAVLGEQFFANSRRAQGRWGERWSAWRASGRRLPDQPVPLLGLGSLLPDSISSCTYFSGQELLPVDQKAVLITGKWTAWSVLEWPLLCLSRTFFFRLGLKRKYLA